MKLLWVPEIGDKLVYDNHSRSELSGELVFKDVGGRYEFIMVVPKCMGKSWNRFPRDVLDQIDLVHQLQCDSFLFNKFDLNTFIYPRK